MYAPAIQSADTSRLTSICLGQAKQRAIDKKSIASTDSTG